MHPNKVWKQQKKYTPISGGERRNSVVGCEEGSIPLWGSNVSAISSSL